jgi:hypothetical protein
MKTSNLIVKMLMTLFLCFVFVGSLVCSEGEVGAACKNPADPGSYATCQDCTGACSNGSVTGCDPDVNDDKSITTVDLQIILRCVQMKCNPVLAKYACYDLNKDNKIDMIDYNIVRKCLGCCSTPSPIK